jgi:protein-S-isoprenylcysteine O-methyltransferase Ste14
MMKMTEAAPGPPPSVTNGYICLAGLTALIAGLAIMSWLNVDVLRITGIAIIIIALTMAIGDLAVLKVHRRTSAGLKPSDEPSNPFDAKRLGVKFVGLAVVLIAIAAFYWAMPIYRRDFYTPFFRLAVWGLPALLALSVPYVVWIDRRMREPRDGTWEAGQVCLGNWRGRDLVAIKTFWLGWVIKAFFLPLMIGGFHAVISWLSSHPIGGGFTSVFATASWFFKLALFADLAFACIGYVLTLRLFDTHIRSVNPLVIGWLVALICYQPFWSVLATYYLNYNDGIGWSNWLSDDGTLIYFWGGTMMLANAAWVWANMTFGMRFSNLTHRGILTNGPYRWTKHPSYIAKNFYWWLIAVPFVSFVSWDEALRNCLLLLLVNLIYVARARTEERHLSADPTYVAYARWINEHGMFRWVGKIMPVLAYRRHLL